MMQKVHRRKNEDIVKDFVCTEGCGKAYGSYAALYTHIKNKHSTIRPPQIKPPGFKHSKATGKKGRPIVKQKQQGQMLIQKQIQFQCKICQESSCQCDDSINNQDVQKTVSIMSNPIFISLLNAIGHLNYSQNFTWIRNTQEDFVFYDQQKIKQQIRDFNNKYKYLKQLHLRDQMIEYLSFSSRYWDKRYINELYQGIFMIKSRSRENQNYIFTQDDKEFDNMWKSQSIKQKEWQQFLQVIKHL